MRLTTWNVNGIRNPFSYPPWNTARTFSAMFDTLGSDIVVMQELKIQRKDLRDDMVLIDGWDCYFSLPKHKKGYSGVGIYTRNATCAPIRAEEGLLGVLPSPSGVAYCDLPEEESIGGYPSAIQVAELGVDPAMLDAEGRCVVLEFPAFVLLGVYSPANSNGLRDDFRYGFITALDCRIRNLIRNGKRVVLVGDLNVSRDELDQAGAFEDCKKEGITHAEYISTPNRRIFNQLIVEGEVIGERDEGREQGVLWDTTRGFHPDRKGMYTHWEQKINARPGNYGGRIDFVLVAESMRGWIRDANIQEGLLGSDHCPVYADFHDRIDYAGKEIALLDVMSPSGVFTDGKRQQEWKVANVPAFSAKRLPEFDKRRSIKSMFAAPSAKKAEGREQPTMNAAVNDFNATLQVQDSNSASTAQRRSEEDFSASAKRKIPSLPKEKSSKRLKSDSAVSTSRGQQSLKGFFQTSSVRTNSASHETHVERQRDATGEASAQSPNGKPRPTETSATAISAFSTPEKRTPAKDRLADDDQDDHDPDTSHPSTAASPTPSDFSAQLEASEQTQRSWNALFSRPVAPMCEGHDEPCKTMQTKKKGSNQGRSFWMCARPLGPSGNKERGTQWRCPTFIWCSDWGGGRKDKEKEKEKEAG
ncbi:DNA lyase-like protein [Neohortaea acidophila]|uniref:DNA-(apurinic or apyrimidinic site) endonuclease 2 n=1 Tax=Neohortaea acidophila TaxID=245834 RepID=A0A6A6Q3S7_9PEZI|nr:DNA lyase-like protein [Neohortaea acidophila]KAF2486047.1 DNA lyase-like protein [Neohortaea acidophila]